MVLQGDVVITPFGKEMALIGVKAPEKNEPCFKESIDKLKTLVVGKNMTLYHNVKDMNLYGRYSRYVFVDDVFVNEVMIRSGLAEAVSEAPNTKYSNLLYEAQVDAVTKRLCLWKDLEADPCLFVAFFNYDAYGVDEYNLNDEFVTFRNICKAKIDLTGWTVQDSAEMYTFPKFVLGPEAAVTLHSGQGQDSELHLYWNNEISVWNDESDTLYLRNPNGDVIIRKHY
ncbi:MAG: lamin tail domain-containing protein [Nanoarchaeota archaeon]|nr:lamin tail domain-containing protein [Nanoarchaeota archaeon]